MIDPAISAMYADADDAVRVVIVPTSESLVLQRDAARGDDEAQALVMIAVAKIREVANAPQDRPVRCACCPQPIRRGDRYLIGCVLPAVGDPTIGLGFLVCDECGMTPEGLDAAVALLVRRHWPDDGAERVPRASDAPDRRSRGGGQA